MSKICLLLCLAVFSLAVVWAGDTVNTEQQNSQPLPSTHKMEQQSYTHMQPEQKKQEGNDGPPSAPSIPVPLPVPATSSSNMQRQGRLFFPGLSSALTGNPSLSSVLTLNLNNLALVGLFLIGVFILLPSIIGFLTGLTGGAPYAAAAAKSLRMDDHPNSSSMWSIMQTLDSILSKNNIDVRVCLERSACHVAKNTFSKARSGNPSTLESILNYAIGSNYGQTLLASYRLKEAADRGRNGEDCDGYYNKCPYSLSNLSKLITTYYSVGSGFFSSSGNSPPPTQQQPTVNNTAPFFMRQNSPSH